MPGWLRCVDPDAVHRGIGKLRGDRPLINGAALRFELDVEPQRLTGLQHNVVLNVLFEAGAFDDN